MRQVPALAGGAASAPWGVAGALDIAGHHRRQPARGRRASCSPRCPGSRADGRAFIADAVARGAVAVLAPQGTDGRPACRRGRCWRIRSRAGAWRSSRPGWPARSRESWSRSPAPTARPAPSSSCARSGPPDGTPAASLGTLGLIAPGFEPGPGLTTPDPVEPGRDAGARWRARASSMRRSRRRRTASTSSGWTACGWPPAAFTNLTRDHLDYHGSRRPTGPPSCGCSPNCCRRARRRWRAATWTPRRWTRWRDIAAAAAAGAAHGRRERFGDPAAGDGAAAGRAGAARRAGRAGTRDRAAAAGPVPGGQRAAGRGTGRWRWASGTRWIGCRRCSGVRGRLELAARLPNGAAVYVDYAHTPDALERLLTALRPHTAGRLHVVFGAGGDRDRGKRPLMGAAAARFADVAIVTDDNPRSEDPAAIRAAVLAACPGGREIGDRAQRHCRGAERAGAGRRAGGGRQGPRAGPDDRRHGGAVRRCDAWSAGWLVRRDGLRMASSPLPPPAGGGGELHANSSPCARSETAGARMTALWTAARPAGGHRRRDGNAVRRHWRLDRYAHACSRAICSSRCAARPATAMPSSPTRWRRARPARWCTATCRMRAQLLLVDDTLAGLHRLGGYARASLHRALDRRHRQRRQDHDEGDAAAILSRSGHTHAAVASYNNHWGVPLTLARMPPDAAFCVAEIGMNHAGEIAPLARLARPHVAVITTIEAAHIGFLGSHRGDRRREGGDPARRWSRAASRCCRPTRRCCRGCATRRGAARVVTFGASAGCRCAADASRARTRTAAMSPSRCTGIAVRFRLNAPGRHMAMNALAALAGAITLRACPTALMAASPRAGGFCPGGRARRAAADRACPAAPRCCWTRATTAMPPRCARRLRCCGCNRRSGASRCWATCWNWATPAPPSTARWPPMSRRRPIGCSPAAR